MMHYPIVEKERVKNHLSITELTRLLGVSRKTYYNWQERGCMNVKYAARLLEIFRVAPAYLFSNLLQDEPPDAVGEDHVEN